MTAIPPAPVRPIGSIPTRLMGVAAIGAGAAIGLAMWADHTFHEMPDADGTSPNRIDRVEARRAFSGWDGMPAVASFSALIAASILYSGARAHITPTEFNATRMAYWGLGGLLVGTSAAPLMLRPLPETGAKPHSG